MEIHAHDREGKRRPRFKPISEIVRSPKGRAIGRVFRHELEGVIEAFTRAGARSLGRFATESAARQAIRAKAHR